jgi:sugar lactone lactonase YvrE
MTALFPFSLRALHISCVRFSLALIVLAGLVAAAQAQVAYTGGPVVLGSGFNSPFGIAVDGSGNVFVTEPFWDGTVDDSGVYEIQAAGGYKTVATLGHGFQFPYGIALDANGNVFVADSSNDAADGGIKEIFAASGYVEMKTLGGGGNGAIGVAIDGNGNIFICFGGGQLDEIPASGAYKYAVPLETGFSFPYGLAVDKSGNLYITEYGNNDVREVLAAGGYTTVKTLGSGFNKPYGVAVDKSGNVFVADTYNNAVKEILAVDGSIPSSPTIETLGSGIDFTIPEGVAVDGDGNVYVADRGNARVVEIKAGQSVVNPNFGDQAVGKSSAALTLPFTIASAAATTVAKVGILTTGIAGLDFTDAGGSTCAAKTYTTATNCVVNVKFAPLAPGLRRGAVVFYDGANNVLATVNISGVGTGPQITFQPGSASTVGSGFNSPYGIAMDAGGNIFVADTGNNAVKEIVAAGGYSTIKTLGSGFNQPGGVAVDSSGNVIVADSGNNAVKEIVASSGYTAVNAFPGSIMNPSGVAVDATGNIFVAATSFPGETRYEGLYEIVAGSGLTAVSVLDEFGPPSGVAVDSSGNVFAFGSGGGGLEFWANSGYGTEEGGYPLDRPVTEVGTAESPNGGALDAAEDIYNAYPGVTFAHIGAPYDSVTLFSGNGSGGVALDGNGNIFVSDSTNNRILKLDVADPQPLSFTTPTLIGKTDATDGPQTERVVNIGNEPLIFTKPGTGTNPSYPAEFPADSTGKSLCAAGTPLLPGASCDLSMNFAPAAKGIITGTVVLTDNTLNRTNATQSMAVSGIGTDGTKIVPTVTWAQPGAITYGTALSAAQLDATASVPGTFAYSPSAGTVLSAGSDTLSVTFNPADPANYTQATATLQLTVNKAGQTIAFPALGGQTAGTELSLAATASSGLPVGFASLTTSICKVSGVWASFVASGSCQLQVTQAGSANYLAAPPVSQTVAVSHATETTSQTISFAPIAAQIAATKFGLQATASSGLPVSFQSATPAVCTVSGTTASLVNYGSCTIQAWQGGNSQYFAAPTVSRQFSVAHATQTIQFAAIGTQTALQSLSLEATASSGLPVTFASINPSICTVSGTTASFVAFGLCGIVASQAGNSEYSPVAASQSFGVAHAGQTLVFPPIPSQTVGTTLSLSATASSGLPVTFYVLAPGVCTVSGTTAKMIATGTCSIEAWQPGNAVYLSSHHVDESFTVTAP